MIFFKCLHIKTCGCCQSCMHWDIKCAIIGFGKLRLRVQILSSSPITTCYNVCPIIFQMLKE